MTISSPLLRGGDMHTPNRMNPEMAKRYVQQVNKGLKLTDTDYIDIWWIPQKGPVWEQFAGMKVKGLTQWNNPEQKVDYKQAAFPVIYGNHYYTLGDPEEFARMLVKDYKDVKGPWFVIVYGANRQYLEQRESRCAQSSLFRRYCVDYGAPLIPIEEPRRDGLRGGRSRLDSRERAALYCAGSCGGFWLGCCVTTPPHQILAA